MTLSSSVVSSPLPLALSACLCNSSSLYVISCWDMTATSVLLLGAGLVDGLGVGVLRLEPGFEFGTPEARVLSGAWTSVSSMAVVVVVVLLTAMIGGKINGKFQIHQWSDRPLT